MKPIITSFLILAISLVTQARLLRHWSDQKLFDLSDSVILTTLTSSAILLPNILESVS